MNESQLVELCQSGRLEHFAQLYDAHVRKIYGFIYYRTHHRETAEDLTSMTFMKALENLKQYDSSRGSFSSWLYRIARNALVDHYRSFRPNQNIETVWDLADRNEAATDFDRAQIFANLQKVMEGITKEQREILIMRFWDEMSYKEIAEVLGKTEASCKMMLSRIITKLSLELVPIY